MRPTLTLDDDLAESLSRPARRLRRGCGGPWGWAVVEPLQLPSVPCRRDPQRAPTAGNLPHPQVMRWLSRHHFQTLVGSLLATSRAGTFRPADLNAYRRASAKPGSLRSMIHWYRAALRTGNPAPTAEAEMVLLPVLILWGEEDRFLACLMAILFPGVSHWIQHEEPEGVARELMAHFFSTSPELGGPCHSPLPFSETLLQRTNLIRLAGLLLPFEGCGGLLQNGEGLIREIRSRKDLPQQPAHNRDPIGALKFHVQLETFA